MSLSLLPENALVGLVTFGTMVRRPLNGLNIYNVANLAQRHTFTRLDTKSVQNRTSFEAVKITLPSRFKKC